jgi:hypothetical protein
MVGMSFDKLLGGAAYLTQNQAFHALGKLGLEWEVAQHLILRSIEIHNADSYESRFVSFATHNGDAFWLRYHVRLSMWSLAKGTIPPENLLA